MKTLVRLGPTDHGRLLTDEEWEASQLEDGYRYEVIDGVLVVSPAAELSHDSQENWLSELWKNYATTHPEIVNYVTHKARIYVPGHTRVTSPEPDLTAYQNFPFDVPWHQRTWRQIHPVFVAEIVCPDNARKDLIRNVDLYAQVPSIREYWILEPLGEEIRMLVYRRRGSRWQRVIEVAEGETYTSRFFPGLAVTLTVE